MHVVVDVTVGVEGVAGAVHADLQPQVGSLVKTNHITEQKTHEHRHLQNTYLSLRRKVLIVPFDAQQKTAKQIPFPHFHQTQTGRLSKNRGDGCRKQKDRCSLRRQCDVWRWPAVDLTSLHEPLPHRLSDVERYPLWGSPGEDVLSSDIALFPDVLVGPQDLQHKPGAVTRRGSRRSCPCKRGVEVCGGHGQGVDVSLRKTPTPNCS